MDESEFRFSQITANLNSDLAKSKNVTVEVNSELLDQLSKAFKNLQGEDSTDDLDNDNSANGIFTKMLTVMLSIVTKGGLGKNPANEVTKLEEKLRSNEDELDEVKQRGLKGNVVVTSPTTNGKTSVIKTDEELGKENSDLLTHIRDLAKEKYSVDLPVADLSACHRLQNGNVILRIWNRRPGSAWSRLVSAIRSGKGTDMNIFFNFHLNLNSD